jgi:hypothetical protein
MKTLETSKEGTIGAIVAPLCGRVGIPFMSCRVGYEMFSKKTDIKRARRVCMTNTHTVAKPVTIIMACTYLGHNGSFSEYGSF